MTIVLRRFWREKALTAAAIVILAVCIGSNLTIFAMVDAVLLRPLPFPEADRLVTMFNSYPKAGVMRDESSVTNYYERRGRIPALSSVAIFWDNTAIVGETGSTQREPVSRVSSEFFSTLGTKLFLGREFTDEEMSLQSDGVAILNNSYWRQYFNGDRNAVGRSIRVNGVLRTIVGVLPQDFRFLSSESRLYLPFSTSPAARVAAERHSGSEARMIARLANGTTLEEAQSQIDGHNKAVGVDDPYAKMIAEAGFHTVVVPLRADHVSSVRQTLLLTQAGVLLLLLIGAVNLVNLLLVQAAGRIKEVAIRIAVGSSRVRIIREVLAETTLLTLAGGLCGLGVAGFGIRALTLLGADRLPLGADVHMGGRLALIAIAGTIVLGVITGLPVAWFSLTSQLSDALHSQSRTGTEGPASQRLRQAFMVAQIAFAFVLLAGAGLLSASLKQAAIVPPGFRPENVLSGQVSLPAITYRSDESLLAFSEKLTGETALQPGVIASGVVTRLPFTGNTIKSAVTVEHHVVHPGESIQGHYWYGVVGDYFKAMSIPLVEGRLISTADSRRSQRVCVVDEDFARRYWPQGGAIGRRLFQGPRELSDAEAFIVVGVVGAVKQGQLTDATAQGAVYFPLVYQTNRNVFLVARTVIKPESLAATIHAVVRRIDPELPIADVRTMETRIADSLVARRSPAVLSGIFAGVALLLTALGIYGVLSYAVRQRRREIGVRMALGAQPSQIRRQFIAMGARLVVAGAVAGVVGAVLTGYAMRGVLFNVRAIDVVNLAITGLVVIVVALIACLAPAHRAARTSPAEIL